MRIGGEVTLPCYVANLGKFYLHFIIMLLQETKIFMSIKSAAKICQKLLENTAKID